VFDVLFDRLLCDFQGIGYFLISPAFSKVFDHGLLSVCKVKPFLGLIGAELLPAPKFF